MYSGGSDSTLAAAMMCENHREVHLLTYYHPGIAHWENSRTNARRLTSRFGPRKVKHYVVDFEKAMKAIYLDSYLGDLLRYRGYMSVNICYACQLAMHACTILHGLSYGVKHACDGYKREKRHIYGFMSEEGITETSRLYETFGMDNSSPVYDIRRTDWQLFEMGLTDRRDVKFPDRDIAFETQHQCPAGTIANAYLLGYCTPMYGSESAIETGLKYWREKIPAAEVFIKEGITVGTLEWHELEYS